MFGAGSLGSLLGGLLAAEHDVTLVGRAPHVDAVAAEGLRMVGLVERRVHPRAVTELDASGRTADGADLALVTVKAYDTAVAAEALAGRDLGAVCSLQNGMGNEETLAGRLDCPVLGGTTTYGARLLEPGAVECTGLGSVTLGPLPGVGSERGASMDVAADVAGAFRAANVPTHVREDIRPVLWEKLAVNAGINPVTALARTENRAVNESRLEPVADRAATEVAGVARAAGVHLEDERAIDALHGVAEETAANRSSMLQDVEAGRRTEVDAISGYVVERADADVPVNRTLAALVRAWESKQGLR